MLPEFSGTLVLDAYTTNNGIGSFLLDLPLFALCFFVTMLATIRYNIPKIYSLILVIHCLLPFFINGFLFPPEYMPDQFKYWKTFNEIRSGEEINHKTTVLYASYLFSMMPIPFAVTVKSLGFANKLLFVSLFAWLWKKEILTEKSALFFLLFPSFALYSGLSLRDQWITVFMIVGTIHAMRNNLFLSILWLLPLSLIKFQNFFIMIMLLSVYRMMNIKEKGLEKQQAIAFISICFSGLLAVFPFVIDDINFFRQAMYTEDGGEGLVTTINGISDFIVHGLTSGFYFMVKPMIYEVGSALQLIQSLENILIICFIFHLIRSIKNINGQMLYWMCFIIISFTIYGLVVFNFGTAVRYKFPFLLVFVIALCYEYKRKKICNSSELD